MLFHNFADTVSNFSDKFLTLGLLIGIMQYALRKNAKKKKLEERAIAEAAAKKEVEE